MPSEQDRKVGRLAILLGVVSLASLASLGVFFLVGDPFGTINDLGNAAVGILSALLAWTLRGRVGAAASGTGVAASGAAILGAGIGVLGSALVVSGATGFFLAGLVSTMGFAFIGLWLIALNRSLWSDARWRPQLRTLGIVGGVLMAIGFATAPGILMGFDDMGTAPGWIWIGFLGWAGTFIVYPVWSIWLGRVLLQVG